MAAIKTALMEEQKFAEAEVFANEPKERFVFDPIEHVYTLDGRPMHGITSVLKVINKPALVQWAANMAVDYIEKACPIGIAMGEIHAANADIERTDQNLLWKPIRQVLDEARVAHRKKKEEAGVAGTGVHEIIERLIKISLDLDGKLGEYMLREDDPPQVREFVQWAIVNDVQFLASEIRLYSEKNFCAGTADFVCRVGNKLMVGDIKTGRAIYQEYWFQTGAYAMMATEMGLYKKFDGLVVVNVPKFGGIKVEYNYDLKGNQKAFLCALYLHKIQESQNVKSS